MRQDDLFDFSDRMLTKADTEQVVLSVCAYFGVSQAQLQDRTRSVRLGNKDHNLAIAKKCLMYILRVHVQLTLEEISGFFGFRDHSNSHHHVEDFRKHLREGHRTCTESYQAVLVMLGQQKDDLSHRIASAISAKCGADMNRDMVRSLNKLDQFLRVYGFQLALVKRKDNGK